MIRPILLLLILPAWVFAHGDEDHGASAEPFAVTAASPRAEAHTELFELVVSPQNGQLLIYLDDYASNQPVGGASVEVESDDWKATASPVEHGTYRVEDPRFSRPGTYPLIFTVTAGDAADLIETTLLVQAPAPDAAVQSRPFRISWPWFAGLISILAAVGVALVRLRRKPAR